MFFFVFLSSGINNWKNTFIIIENTTTKFIRYSVSQAVDKTERCLSGDSPLKFIKEFKYRKHVHTR